MSAPSRQPPCPSQSGTTPTGSLVGTTRRATVSTTARPLVSWLLGLWGLIILFPCGGATCPRRSPPLFTPPLVFKEPPTREQLMERLENFRRIERLNSNTLTLSSPEAPIELSGNLSWHRPDHFRLQAYPAGTRILGDALDAGSNSDTFWMLTKIPGQPATLYYARHQEFEMQPGPRHILPVSPLWIREAMGVIEFDPSWHHEGPMQRGGDGLVEIRSLIPTNRGTYKRIAIIEPTRVTLRQLVLIDPDGKMVASANQSQHQYYNAIDASLPHRVDLQLQPNAGQVMAFTLKVGNYILNEAMGDEALRYAMPEATSGQAVNLVQANATLSQGELPTAPPPPPPAARSATAFNPMQEYRFR